MKGKQACKVLPIYIHDPTWKLLGMYLVAINYELRKSGKRQTNISHLIGAILTRHVQAHADYIRREFYRIHLELVREGALPKFFSADQLEAIDGASAEELPALLRIGNRPASAPNRQSTRRPKRALRDAGKGPSRDLLRAPGQPGRVRARRGRTTPDAGQRDPED